MTPLRPAFGRRLATVPGAQPTATPASAPRISASPRPAPMEQTPTTWRLEAAAALVESGRHERTHSGYWIRSRPTNRSGAPGSSARIPGGRCPSRHERAARAAWKEADRLSAGTGSDVEVRVRIESSEIAADFDGDHAEGLRRAEEAYRLARRRGVHLHRARHRLGTRRLWEGKEGWGLLRSSIDDAFAQRDYVTVSGAVASLVYGLLITGQPDSGRRIATRMAATAAELKLLGMERYLARGSAASSGTPVCRRGRWTRRSGSSAPPATPPRAACAILPGAVADRARQVRRGPADCGRAAACLRTTPGTGCSRTSSS